MFKYLSLIFIAACVSARSFASLDIPAVSVPDCIDPFRSVARLPFPEGWNLAESLDGMTLSKGQILKKMRLLGLIPTENFDFMNKLAWNSPVLALVMKHGIGAAAARDPRFNHLMKLVAANEFSDEAFLESARRWKDSFHDFKFVDAHELAPLAHELASRGLYSGQRIYNGSKGFKSFVQAVITLPNGVINAELWTFLVANGKLPLVDPHDLFMHAAWLGNERFRMTLQDHSRAANLVIRLENAFFQESDSSPNLVWLKSLGNQLWTLNSHTFENMSFVEPVGKDSFFLSLQGNAGFNGITQMLATIRGTYPDFEAAAKTFMAESSLDIRSLPDFDLFRQSHVREVDDFESFADKLGISHAGEHQAQTKKMWQLMEQAYKGSKHLENLATIGDSMLKNIAGEIYKDARLRLLYDPKNRLELFEKGNALFNAYLKFQIKRHGLGKKALEVQATTLPFGIAR